MREKACRVDGGCDFAINNILYAHYSHQSIRTDMMCTSQPAATPPPPPRNTRARATQYHRVCTINNRNDGIMYIYSDTHTPPNRGMMCECVRVLFRLCLYIWGARSRTVVITVRPRLIRADLYAKRRLYRTVAASFLHWVLSPRFLTSRC